MSINNIVLNNGQQAIINYDVSKIFVWDNRYEKADYTNSSYDAVTLRPGTLMGRIATTQEIVPLDSGAVDGSQYPVGILASDIEVPEGESAVLYICVAGDVVEDKVILADGDTMNTIISGRSIRDRIAADTVGIKLVPSTEMTGFDNQ
jgi:hypothetical protein